MEQFCADAGVSFSTLTVRTKIVNEKGRFQMRRKKRMAEMNML